LILASLLFNSAHQIIKCYCCKNQGIQLPKLERSRFEDAFDEIELLGFLFRLLLELLQSKYRGDVMAKDLDQHHKKPYAWLSYFEKQVLTARGTMYFGTWVDHEGTYFDTTHFPDNLLNTLFKVAAAIYY
jgi:DNA polymerase-3 subunit alpha/error-prone DNA polymerase